MSKTNSKAGAIAQIFSDYCEGKKYQVRQSEEANNLRLDISNASERTIIKIYNNSTIQIQGKQNSLKTEMETLKAEFEANPQSMLGHTISEIKACTAKYDIILPELRSKIKQSLSTLGDLEVIDNPHPAIEYKAKIIRNGSSLTLTQYTKGTLLLQGKTNKLFDECCDQIEKITNPEEKEIIFRFISSDEKSLGIFDASYSTRLIGLAERNVRDKIGDVYEYLEPYDKKWFVASECLCLTKIPLPEFSPLVMPASKAFEGFAKKLLIGIGLFEPDHFKTKKGDFYELYNSKSAKREVICGKERYAETMLKKIGLYLETNRNFMMHSDDSKITKINTFEEAERKVNKVFEDTKEIFEYFNDLYKLVSE